MSDKTGKQISQGVPLQKAKGDAFKNNMMRFTLSSIIKDAAILAVLCVAALAAILVTPRTARVTRSLGSYTFVKIGDSYSLYTDGSHRYFLFTPLGQAKLSSVNPLIEQLSDLYNHIKIYLNTNNNNSVALTGPMTIIYGRDDFVIVNDTLLTENPENLRQTLERSLALVLTPSDPLVRTMNVSTKKILIINPDIAGMIEVISSGDESIKIHKDTRTITFEKRTEIQIHVL